MRNGLPFSKLVLVGSGGQSASQQDAVDDAAIDYVIEPGNDAAAGDRTNPARATLLVFMAVSIACTAAALATGSYAVWLGRQQAAQRALTDVNDLLKTCQTRMLQLETDVKSLPRRA